MRQARIELLEEIGQFLLGNDLDVSRENLVAAYAICSGQHIRLARKIRQHTANRGTINQEWLDAMLKEDPTDADVAAIEDLMSKAEESIDTFKESAKAAHHASSEYGSELEQHSHRLERARDAGEIVAGLAELAHVMLQQTRKVEAEMRSSEEEANALRRKLEQAKRDAEVDHLTGLPNRRAFEALLDLHYREAQQAIDPLCVAFCDIDHFKQINDTHGHDTGDRVIRAIAETLGRISNSDCHVARHGGEEFVMLFRGKTASEAHACLDQVRIQLANRKFVNRKTDLPIGQVTFSAGIADVFSYSNPRAALTAADDALYQAKAGGRNQIMLACEPRQ